MSRSKNTSDPQHHTINWWSILSLRLHLLVVSQVLYTGFNELGLDAAVHGETHQSVKGLFRLRQQPLWQFGLHKTMMTNHKLSRYSWKCPIWIIRVFTLTLQTAHHASHRALWLKIVHLVTQTVQKTLSGQTFDTQADMVIQCNNPLLFLNLYEIQTLKVARSRARYCMCDRFPVCT